ncbi:unnamed protein product, partial [Heterotrigona itama]
MRKLKRMRSDTNLIVNRLCSKLADSKYRTRSLTTLISSESYETYDSRDTISRIIDDPNLTTAQKTMRILGLTDQDIADARARIKERAIREKLSVQDDDSLGRANKRDVSRYFFDEYDSNVLKEDEQSTRSSVDETSMEDEIATNERQANEITITDESSACDKVTSESETAEDRVAMDETANDKNVNGTAGQDRVTTDEITSGEIIVNNNTTLRNPSTFSRNVDPSNSFESIQHSSMKKEGRADFPQTNQYGGSSSTERDSSRVNFSRQSVEMSPMERRSLFGCNCIVDDYLYNKTLDEYCLSNGPMMRNSTPDESIDEDKMSENREDDLENSNDTTYHSCLDNTDQSIENQRAEFPLIQKLLQNDLNILRSIGRDDRRFENSSNDKPISGDESTGGFSRSYASIDVQSLSAILKDLSVTRNVVTNFGTLKIVESNEIVNTVQRSGRNTEGNVVKVSSFGDANIPRFFKDSMKVFDGCYEKDFANNTELQCLLRQLEKKKWSIFPAQLGQAPSNVLKEQIDHGNPSSTVQDLRMQRLGLSNDGNFSTMKRHEISTSTPSKAIYGEEHLAPEIMQMNEQFLDALSDARKPKDAHTQTEDDDRQEQRSKGSNEVNLVDEAQKRHRKTFFKCKRPKEQSEANHREQKTRDTRASKRLPQIAEKSDEKYATQRKPIENPRNKPDSARSPSDESVCECVKAQSSEVKSDRRREMNRKCTARCKVETFGTIPFSQVVRPAIFDSVIYRRKPPAYPRWAKSQPGNVSNAANSRKASSTFKTLADETSKKPADKQSAVHSPRKFKWKSRAEETESREMRALKAYNEVTLLKDKKALDARKRPTAGRQQLAAVATPESSRTHSRKNRPDRCKRNVPRNVDDYLDKENLFVDATTETEPLLNIPVKNSKTFVTTNDGRKTLLSCSNKLSKVNKIADKLLLDNFDRLVGGQAKGSKRTGEVETKKQHTKYSRPTKLTREEENNDGSMVSMRKLEGTQKGQDLERTPGKKDVRGPLEIPAASSDVDSCLLAENERDKETSTSANLCVDFGAQAGRLLTVVKPTTQDVASSWSSSTVEAQEDEPYFPEQDDASTQTTEHGATSEHEEKRQTVKTEDYEKENELASETEEPATLKTAENQNEFDPVSKMEEFESALEEQAKGIDRISGAEERRKEASNIRDDCQGQVEEKEKEETKESIVSDDVPRDEAKENVEVRGDGLVEEDKKEETKETLDDVFPKSTEVLRNERETVRVRGDRGLEVLQNEPETISRRLISNLSDLAGSIDINYVILNSFDAPRESDTPVWDIVDEDTIRTLHNMFAYRSLDASFDLSGEFHTMEEILNGRQTVSSSSSSSSLDDFIFQPSIDFPANLSMYEHTALRAMIRPRRGLEEEEEEEDDGEDSLCDLCITSIDREHLPEIDSFEIEEISAEHPIVSELGLNDLLIQVVRIWRRLNVRGLLSGVLETLHDPLNDDRTDTSQLVSSHDEREDDETHRGCSLEDQRVLKFFQDDCLRFVNEDIFTNIKFPVVINLTDAIPNSLEVAFDDQEDPEDTELDLDVVLEQAEPSKTNLFSLMDDEHEADMEFINEIGDEDEETTRNEYLKTLQRLSSMSIVNSYDAFGRVLHDENEASYSKDQILIASCANKLKKCMLVRSVPVQRRRGDLNRTCEETLEEIEETLEIVERSIDSEEIMDEIIMATEDVEDVEKLRTKDTDEREEIEKIYKYEDVDEDAALPVAKEDTQVEACKKEAEMIDENIQLVELDGEEDNSLERTNSNEQRIVTLYTILTFWMLVFCFYVRYFYQKIILFKQASTSTSTLKPFEIHAVPTSTTTFLENSILIDRIEAKETEEELDEDDSFDRIVDLEMIDVSRFDEYDSVMNFDSTLYATLSNSLIVKALNEDDSKGTDESAVCLRERILGNIEICPNESQGEEIETSVESDSRMQPVSLTLNSEFTDSSFAIEPKVEEDSLELRLAAEEIETLRYKQDDDFDDLRETKVRRNAVAAKFVKVRGRSSEDEDEEEKRDERSSSEANFMQMRTNDSFDSTYTAISQVSRNAASAIDLNDSSMEEFAIASNESGESNEGI